MLAVDNAIYDRLVSSVALMALVAPFGGGKAVFTESPLPPGVVPPFIIVPEPQVDIPGVFDTKNTNGRQWVRDVGCYTRARGDPSTVEAMAELVRGLFHRKHGSINVVGFGVMICTADGPVRAPTDDTMYGRLVTITLTATE
jgi:hypothetical protein